MNQNCNRKQNSGVNEKLFLHPYLLKSIHLKRIRLLIQPHRQIGIMQAGTIRLTELHWCGASSVCIRDIRIERSLD